MPNKSFMEDILTLGGGVVHNLTEARHELKAQAKQRAGAVARDFDLVTREEFDIAFDMIQKARMMQEELASRLTQIEKHFKLSSGKNMVKTKKSSLPSVKTKAKTRKRK